MTFLFIVARAVLCLVVSQFGMVAGELIDLGASELAGRDLVLEQYIHLAIRAALGFGETEVVVCPDQETDTCPEEAFGNVSISLGGDDLL